MLEKWNKFKTKFCEELVKIVASKSSNSFYISKTKHSDLLTSVKEAKLATTLTDLQRQRLQVFTFFR